MSEIGRATGRNPSTVAYWLRKYGIEDVVRRGHGPRGPLARDRVEALVRLNLSVAEIATEVGRSRSTVRYWLTRYGLRTTDAARAKVGGQRLPREQRRCAKHGLAEHVVRRGGADCLRCRAERVSEWRRRAKRKLVDEAGGSCRLCGYDRTVAALQFHHLDPSTKRFGLGSRGLARSIEALREEAAKCVLLCSNCHAEVEAGITRLP